MAAMEGITQFLMSLPPGTQIVLAVVFLMYLLRIADGLFMKNKMSEATTIRPRSREHLLAVVVAHWFHRNRKHLLGNTFPYLVMGSMIANMDLGEFWVVTGLVALISGLGTWIFGAKGNHEGASGLISGYFGYILLNSFRTNDLEPMLWALGVSAVNFALLKTAFGYYEGLSRALYFFGLMGGLLSVFVWQRIAVGAVG